MNTKSQLFRSVISSMPYTGGGLKCQAVLSDYDQEFKPRGRRIPTFEDMMECLQRLQIAQRSDIQWATRP